jgi:RNA-binding protein YhbY
VDGVDPRALRLIDAVSNEGQPSSGSARVFVYQRNVERLAASIEQIREHSGSELVQTIGKTASFFKHNPDRNQFPLPK